MLSFLSIRVLSQPPPRWALPMAEWGMGDAVPLVGTGGVRAVLCRARAAPPGSLGAQRDV